MWVFKLNPDFSKFLLFVLHCRKRKKGKEKKRKEGKGTRDREGGGKRGREEKGGEGRKRNFRMKSQAGSEPLCLSE